MLAFEQAAKETNNVTAKIDNFIVYIPFKFSILSMKIEYNRINETSKHSDNENERVVYPLQL